MKFTYSSGQRPLDGYTIKRGVGSGGFGEVYYALSDGGKEVALKFVRGPYEIELRGIAQCLNLKHPHLVSLFDLRTDPLGQAWVVMEYVAGETLNVVLNRHPQGLAPELVRPWFLALARAVGYLHDNGIVHRDLKPSNIFLENGTLKLGDYGLSKCISGHSRAAQTQSIGTVYYMAPEISTGNYNRQIDIYAAGIILFEMLTGRVPFDGESAGEILMKHLTSPPDLARVPPAFIPILSKALAKNPAQRYATIGELARAVENVPLKTASAERPVPQRPVAPPPRPAVPLRPPQPVAAEVIPEVIPVISGRAQLAELAGSMSVAGGLAGLLALVFQALSRQAGFLDAGTLFFLTLATCWVVLVPAKLWNERKGDSWSRRTVMLVLGLGVGALTLWLKGHVLAPDLTLLTPESLGVVDHLGIAGPPPALNVAAGYLSFFGLGLSVLRWWKLADRQRSHRIHFFSIVMVGGLGLLLNGPFWPRFELPLGMIALPASAFIVQWVSPGRPPTPPTARPLRLRYT